jgi:hypothetical protein
MPRSLTRFYLQPLPLLLLCLALAAWGAYLMISEIHESHHRDEAAALSRQIAESLGTHISGQQSQLERIAAQPELVQLLRRGKREERARKADELAKLLPHARDVWLLTQEDMAAGDAYLPPGPQCLTYLRRMADAKSPLPAELHSLNLSSEHYDLVQPVLDGGRRVALLSVRFASAPVRALIARVQEQQHGYIELNQTIENAAEPIASWGDPELKHDATAGQGWILCYQASLIFLWFYSALYLFF